MTALAAFFALIPMALALERGSEANAPLGRAILGGLLAGEPATLFVLPCLYSLLVRDRAGVLTASQATASSKVPKRAATPWKIESRMTSTTTEFPGRTHNSVLLQLTPFARGG